MIGHSIDKKLILLIEDNPDDEALALRALKKSNIEGEIIIARDGLEALDYLLGRSAYEGRDTSEQPRLILLDLNLPKMGGLEVLKRIRENPVTTYLPVVILSTSTEQKDLVSGYNLGANSYIPKPINFDQFIDAVNLLGHYWLSCNTPPPPARHG